MTDPAPIPPLERLLPALTLLRSGRRAAGAIALMAIVAAVALLLVRAESIADGLVSFALSLLVLVIDPGRHDVVFRYDVIEWWFAAIVAVILPFVIRWLTGKTAHAPRIDERAHELSHWRIAWRRLRMHPLPMSGFWIILFSYLVVLLCPLLAPHRPNAFSDGIVTQYLPPFSHVETLYFRNDRIRPPDQPRTHDQSPIADVLRILLRTNARLTDDGIGKVMFVNGFHVEESDVVATVGYEVRRIPISELIGTEPMQFSGRTYFLLGTDTYGRDLLSRIIYGSRVSLTLGLIAVLLSVSLGAGVGLFAGYFGRWADGATMRFVDIMLAFPSLFLILMIIAVFEHTSVPRIILIVVVLGLTSWMGVARLVRGEVLSIKEREFVHAARAIGLGHGRILFRHILPNTLTPIIINATLRIGGIILVEAALSYLNLGVQQPTASWGSIIFEGKDVLSNAWWISTFPGFTIVVTVVCFNLLGDGLRDAFDPLSLSRR